MGWRQACYTEPRELLMKLNGWNRLYIVATVFWLILNATEVISDLTINLSNASCEREGDTKGLYACKLYDRLMTSEEIDILHASLNSKPSSQNTNPFSKYVTDEVILARLNTEHTICIKDQSGLFPMEHSSYVHRTFDIEWKLNTERLSYAVIFILAVPIALWTSLFVVVRLFLWVKEGFNQA